MFSCSISQHVTGKVIPGIAYQTVSSLFYGGTPFREAVCNGAMGIGKLQEVSLALLDASSPRAAVPKCTMVTVPFFYSGFFCDLT